jgi:hypothetical protein
MKNSYDKIFHEFLKVEKVTKEVSSINKEIDEKRKNRIKMLELKLQGFTDEIKHVNFHNIHKQFDDLSLSDQINDTMKNNNVNRSSNMLIENELRLQNKKNNLNSIKIEENNNNNNNNNVLIDQIMNMNATKGDDMFQFIESLLLHTESEVDMEGTVQNLKQHK